MTDTPQFEEQPDYSLYAPEGQVYAPWLKYYDSGIASSIETPEQPIYSWLDKAADRTPNSMAVCFQNYKLTYSELRELAEIAAANLRANGIQQGDRVAIMLPNLPQTYIAFWAVAKAGGVVVMTNPLYMENELIHQFNDSGAKCLITADMIWPKINPLRPRLGIKKYFVTSVADGLRFPQNVLFRFKERKRDYGLHFDEYNILPFNKLLQGKERLSTPVSNPAETLVALQYTGGTTGTPKGAMLTHANFNANALQITETLKEGLLKQHKFLAVLPLFHVYGLSTCLLLPAVVGASAYVMARFNPIEVLKCIQKNKITLFPGAPSVYIAILQHKDVEKYDLTSLDIAIAGSAPMPVEYINMFKEKTGGDIIEGYGLTEASPITTLNPLHGERKAGSIGMPIPSTLCRIVDMELGNVPLRPGEAGELIVKGPQVMKGYWNRPDATGNTVRNGWLYTGDIATMDEQGYIFIVDRKKDMVLVGGYNVYPREVDEVLFSHPKIKEAVSVGVPHKTRGEVLKAFIVLKPGEEMSKNDVIVYCRSKLANYKVPKLVEFRTELPKSTIGKILRRAIRCQEEEQAKNTERAEEIIE